MAEASISARIRGDNRDFKAALSESESAARSWAGRMGGLRANVAGGLAGGVAGGADGLMGGMFSAAAFARLASNIAMVTAGIVGLSKAMRFGDNLRDLQDGLEGVGEDVESVAEQLKKLEDISISPGVDFFQAANASKALRSIGYSAEQTRAIILALGNALAKTGQADEELAGIVETLTKISDKGEISEKQFVSLMQAAPAIRNAFKNMGIETAQQLEKLGTDTKQIIAGLVTELQKVKPVPIDPADEARWAANIRKLRMQQASMAAADVKVLPELTDTTGTTAAARALRLQAAAPDAAAAEAKRLEKLRMLESERALKAQIEQIEKRSEGTQDRFATAQREELAILEQKDKLMKDANVTAEEAVNFLKQSVQLEEARFNVKQASDALDKATETKKKSEEAAAKKREEEGRGPLIRSFGAAASAERQFMRNPALRKQYGTYDKYLNRESEQGSMALEPQWRHQFKGLDAFNQFKQDSSWGRVPTKQEAEKAAHKERVEKATGTSPEAKAMQEATTEFKKAVSALETLANKTKGEPVQRSSGTN